MLDPVSRVVGAVVVLAAAAFGQMLPEAPSTAKLEPPALPVVAVRTPVQIPAPSPEKLKIVDKKFLTLAALSTLTTFADSFTTTWARQNWLAGKDNVCNIERQSTYLYGTHPTPGRVYMVAAFKSVGTVALSYYLRKHRKRLWSTPLLANTVLNLEGVGMNLAMCN